jgi:hypothetical protein
MAPPASSLSDKDRALLTVYIAVRFNLVELASQTSQELLSLQDWALQPSIQAQVARYRQLETLQHETEAADAKSAGLATLLDLLTTTQDPIERRRAAQTLIRVGSPDPARAESQTSPETRPLAGNQPHPARLPAARPDSDADDSFEDELDDEFEEPDPGEADDERSAQLQTVSAAAAAPEPLPARLPIPPDEAVPTKGDDPARRNGRHATSGP